MTPAEVLDACAVEGVVLSITDGTLRCCAPKGVLTPELKASIREVKADLIAILTSPVTVTQLPETRGLANNVTVTSVTSLLSWIPPGDCSLAGGEILRNIAIAREQIEREARLSPDAAAERFYGRGQALKRRPRR